MGEIANDIIAGRCCAECGVYFEKGHGYPVLCKSCGGSYSAEELKKLGYSVATNKEL